MSAHYILADDNSVQAVGVMEWAAWFEAKSERRRICFDELHGARVSTVFLGLDHSFSDGPPLIFETMVFPLDNYDERLCWRYATYDAARDGHAKAVELTRQCLREERSLRSLAEVEQPA